MSRCRACFPWLSVADADADKIALETRYRFKMPFASFRDVITPLEQNEGQGQGCDT